jgi:hypothetical protein
MWVKEWFQSGADHAIGHIPWLVMRGLDPRIHQKQILFDGLPGQARQ